jgi:hypothetical protein
VQPNVGYNGRSLLDAVRLSEACADAMWSWSLNWGEVTPHILVGSCPMTADDLGRIASETQASAVLSVQHDDCLSYWNIDYARLRQRGRRLGLVMTRCPMRDFDLADQRRHLPHAVATLADLQAAGHRTYVHCTAGLGRSPLTVLGYLTLVKGDSPDRAVEMIHAARPGAVPAWEAYHGCRDDLLATQRHRVEKRAYEIFQGGSRGSSQADWLQAESDVLRALILSMADSPAACRDRSDATS